MGIYDYERLRPLKLLGSLLEVVRVFFRKDGKKIEWKPNQSHTYTGDMTYEFPAPDSAANSSDILVSEQSAQTLTNKSLNFNAGGNVAADLPLSSMRTDPSASNKVIIRNADGVLTNALVGSSHLDEPLTSLIDAKADVSALSSETTARTAADSALGTRVSTLEAVPAVDISGKANITALTNETAARQSADTTLAAADSALGIRIDGEISDRAGAVTSALSTAASYTDTKVAALVNGAPETLDTLNEIAVHLASGDSTAAALATTVGTKASQSALDSEAGTRASADSTLSDRATALEANSFVGYSADWTPAQGNTRTIEHSLGQNLQVQVMESGTQIYVDRVTITSTQIVLYSPHTPATTLQVLYRKI